MTKTRPRVEIRLIEEDFDRLAAGETVHAPRLDGAGVVRVLLLSHRTPHRDTVRPEDWAPSEDGPPLPVDHPIWNGADLLIDLHDIFDAQMFGGFLFRGRTADVMLHTSACDLMTADAQRDAREAVVGSPDGTGPPSARRRKSQRKHLSGR